MVIEQFYNVFKVSWLDFIRTFTALTLVVRFWSSRRDGSLPSCASVLCGRYEDFLRGDDKLTRGTNNHTRYSLVS